MNTSTWLLNYIKHALIPMLLPYLVPGTDNSMVNGTRRPQKLSQGAETGQTQDLRTRAALTAAEWID